MFVLILHVRVLVYYSLFLFWATYSSSMDDFSRVILLNFVLNVFGAGFTLHPMCRGILANDKRPGIL